MKSTLPARRLIRAVLQKCGGNQSEASRRLKLKYQSHLYKMLHGTMRDTPEMRAALARAEVRARRAWALERDEHTPALDRASALYLITEMERQVAALKKIVEVCAPPHANLPPPVVTAPVVIEGGD